MNQKVYELNTADVLDHLATMEDNSLDGCLCDPPYGLNFMGKRWDHGVPSTEVWKEVLRVLKPGAFLMAFGGTRTFHRLMVNIEDAGFEMRDTLMWTFGSGFPKSLNISKALDRKAGKLGVEGSSFTVAGYSHNPNKIQHTAPSKGYSPPAPTTPEAELWEGYGTALKPAWEPIVLAQKPREGTFANNVLKYGVGGLNIDGCRVPAKNPRKVKTGRSNPNGGKVNSTDYGEYAEWDGEYKEENKGRWPANFIHDGSDEVVELFPYTESPSGMNYRNASENRAMSGPNTERSLSPNGHNDSGSAARFFYCAKVNKKERNAGCENMKEKVTSHDGRETEIENPYQRNKSSYNNNNNHPTVKPLSLLKYLANLILPPKREEPTRTLFVPYSGSGSEMIGGLQAGWDKVIGIEKDEGYSEIAEARLEYWIQQLYEETTVKEGETLKLFD
jgi:site-specific DNA-methyltransferase (adenine-specific)